MIMVFELFVVKFGVVGGVNGVEFVCVEYVFKF